MFRPGCADRISCCFQGCNKFFGHSRRSAGACTEMQGIEGEVHATARSKAAIVPVAVRSQVYRRATAGPVTESVLRNC